LKAGKKAPDNGSLNLRNLSAGMAGQKVSGVKEFMRFLHLSWSIFQSHGLSGSWGWEDLPFIRACSIFGKYISGDKPTPDQTLLTISKLFSRTKMQ
jgi:hypothetical protein